MLEMRLVNRIEKRLKTFSTPKVGFEETLYQALMLPVATFLGTVWMEPLLWPWLGHVGHTLHQYIISKTTIQLFLSHFRIARNHAAAEQMDTHQSRVDDRYPLRACPGVETPAKIVQ